MSATPPTQKYGTIVTDRGRQIIAAAVATNTKVDIKYVALGDGNGAEYYPSATQTVLKNQVFQAEANSVHQDEDNLSWIVVQMYVPESIGGWWVREVAVKTAGGDVLAIGTVAPSYKPIMEDGSAAGTYYRIILEVSNASVVNLIVDPSTVMASRDEVEKLIAKHAAQTNVHGGTYEKTPSRLMLRNAKGQCQVAAPEHEDDATPRGWVETAVSEALTEIYSAWDRMRQQMLEQLEEMKANSGLYVGKISLLPFRPLELPDFWYFCNGDRFALSGAQGLVLSGLPTSLKVDWGIVVSGVSINVPNLFYDGRGAFLRAVDGSARLPGSWEDDAIRNIEGTAGPISHTFGNYGSATGAFSKVEETSVSHLNASGHCGRIVFNARNVVPTADENRSLNIGMTPAIYLGA